MSRKNFLCCSVQAESPDEGAFVAAARNLGFCFSRRTTKEIFIRVASGQGIIGGDGFEERYTVLNVNAFDNDRKRSSVVVRDSFDSISLLVKGADTSIMPFVDNQNCPSINETQAHLNIFGDQGLRTLVFAGRILSEEEYSAWNEDVQAASLLSDGRDVALRQLAARIEENHSEPDRPSALIDGSTPFVGKLTLYGVTALEDKLQQNVGHCISQLSKAMIKIWILTGDKMETAINIGFATAVITSEMEPLLRICQEDFNHMEDGWQKNASALELRLFGMIQLASQMEVDRLVVQLGKTLNSLRGEEALFRELLETVKDAWEQSEASKSTSVKLNAAVLRKRTKEKSKGESGKNRLKAALQAAEMKLKEALLRARIRSAILRMNEQTRIRRVGGYGLVIDGTCLRAALHPENKIIFLTVAVRCKAVICCRVTPAQKAQVGTYRGVPCLNLNI